ncbi:hypothetical protein CLF_105408 [Clonorchis sinensis]|uniref:Uncharacterized protein n=1 Tax=Clonorchis sinensis TaxID=79923 RepID=G7YDH9_CLOSI|nr:hypothetical protein CLF_105408 [Clonorchis sinensis]
MALVKSKLNHNRKSSVEKPILLAKHTRMHANTFWLPTAAAEKIQNGGFCTNERSCKYRMLNRVDDKSCVFGSCELSFRAMVAVETSIIFEQSYQVWTTSPDGFCHTDKGDHPGLCTDSPFAGDAQPVDRKGWSKISAVVVCPERQRPYQKQRLQSAERTVTTFHIPTNFRRVNAQMVLRHDWHVYASDRRLKEQQERAVLRCFKSPIRVYVRKIYGIEFADDKTKDPMKKKESASEDNEDGCNDDNEEGVDGDDDGEGQSFFSEEGIEENGDEKILVWKPREKGNSTPSEKPSWRLFNIAKVYNSIAGESRTDGTKNKKLATSKSAIKAFTVLRTNRRIFSRITRIVFKKLCVAYAAPTLEYANHFVYSGRRNDVTLIERAQRAATEIVAGHKSVDYGTRQQCLTYFPPEYHHLQGYLILTHVLFLSVDSANTRRGCGEQQPLNDENKTDSQKARSYVLILESVNPCFPLKARSAKPAEQLMASLRAYRLRPSYTSAAIGVDYFVQFFIDKVLISSLNTWGLKNSELLLHRFISDVAEREWREWTSLSDTTSCGEPFEELNVLSCTLRVEYVARKLYAPPEKKTLCRTRSNQTDTFALHCYPAQLSSKGKVAFVKRLKKHQIGMRCQRVRRFLQDPWVAFVGPQRAESADLVQELMNAPTVKAKSGFLPRGNPVCAGRLSAADGVFSPWAKITTTANCNPFNTTFWRTNFAVVQGANLRLFGFLGILALFGRKVVSSPSFRSCVDIRVCATSSNGPLIDGKSAST